MLAKQYNPKEAEPRWVSKWRENETYFFSPQGSQRVYSIDTPPPTVSGKLHLGHTYSYSHADFVARFWRMNGRRVFYPMGYDDNGLPTEKLVEKSLGITANQVGRDAFIDKCLEVSEQAEKEYQELWQRLGLSIDWRFTYRTIDKRARKISQLSFIDLYRNNLAYRQKAPAIWCTECQTSIAQAELDDLERQSEFVTLAFRREDGTNLPIATTRPELLPACVAVFVHPQDDRFKSLIGQTVSVPLFGQKVTVIADPLADPEKGTGAVMCCTFGDTTDVQWWRIHQLPLIEAIGRDGRMTEAAGDFANLTIAEARQKIIDALDAKGLVLARQPTSQSIRVHERCDTPVEYIIAQQWFVRILDHKSELIEAGQRINWQPEYMKARYRAWVENLNWDWCISRQRYFGVTFPLWYCEACNEVILADDDQLPVDPTVDSPRGPCSCGSTNFIPETDVMDTWATSSMTPQIVGRWSESQGDKKGGLYHQVFPFSLRPQAHEIIRTWAFYTIVKTLYHYNEIPWKNALISGWGIAGQGMGKISKSRGGGPMAPLEMIERYSADAVRYWAASANPGKDAIISEDKIQLGAKLVTKVWNVARFSERFLVDFPPDQERPSLSDFTPADRWILARLQTLIQHVTDLLETSEYAAAKNETESFFWGELADNYIEMAKQRLYDPDHPKHMAARYTLYQATLVTLKLFAPFLPFVTEEIYQGLFVKDSLPGRNGISSIHTSSWPTVDPMLDDSIASQYGASLIGIATVVRRYKSEHNLSLGSELSLLQIRTDELALAGMLREAGSDICSITRAQRMELVSDFDPGSKPILVEDGLEIAFA